MKNFSLLWVTVKEFFHPSEDRASIVLLLKRRRPIVESVLRGASRRAWNLEFDTDDHKNEVIVITESIGFIELPGHMVHFVNSASPFSKGLPWVCGEPVK